MKRRRMLGVSALGVAALAAGGFAVDALADSASPSDDSASRPFRDSDPFNTPVSDPEVADDSDELVAALLGGSVAAPVVDLTHFGASVLRAESSTPRFSVVPANTGDWGDNPFSGRKIPWDASWKVPPGDDSYVDGWAIVLDGDTAYELWQTKFSGGKLSCSWGDVTNVGADDGSCTPVAGRGTGANLSCLAGRITAAEWRAGRVDHALSFGCEISNSDFVPPATASDGGNKPGTGTIPEGTRIWLDSAYDVDGDGSLKPYERIVATALQKYGAYCGDNAGSFSFGAEFAADATADDPGSAARSVGITGDYPKLGNVPWKQYLRVLKPAKAN